MKKTVKIVAPGTRNGWKSIGLDEFNPDKHERYVEVPMQEETAGQVTTRETVAKMKKAEVVKMLVDHGVQAHPGTPVEDLRTQLAGILLAGEPDPAKTEDTDNLLE